MNKKTGILVSTIILMVILIAGGAFFVLNKAKKERINTIKLVDNYRKQNEYSKALGILEVLLSSDADDSEIIELMDKLNTEKRSFEEKKSLDQLKIEEEREKEAEKIRIENEEKLVESLLSTQKAKEEKELKEKIDLLVSSVIEEFSNDQLKEAELLRKEILKLDPVNTYAKDLKDKIIEREKELENKKEREIRLKKEREINDIILKAKNMLKDKEFNQSEALFHKALSLDEKNIDALKGLADISIANSQKNASEIPRGINRVLKVLEEEPDNSIYLKSLAQLYEDQGDYKKELEVVKRILKIEPSAEYYVKAGIASYKITIYRGALSYFNLAVKADSEYPEIYYPMALSYEKLNDNINREKMLNRGAELRPEHAATHYELGRLYTEKEEFSRALTLFLMASKINSSSVKYNMGVALALFNLEEYKKAITLYEAITNIDQSISEVYYNLSMARTKTGDYDQALVDISMAIKLKPISPTYLYTIGEISEALGRDDNAITYYLSAIKLDKEYYKPMLNLGNIYEKQEKYSDGLMILKRAFAINPEDPGVRFSLGTSYLHNKEYESSLVLLEEAYNMDKESPVKLYNLSLAHTEVGENEKAEMGFKKVIEMDLNFYDAYYYLGQLLYSLDRKEEARTLFNRVLELNPDYQYKDKIFEML